MKCPYCGEEMTKGVLCPTGGTTAAWVGWVSEAYEKQHPYPPVTKKGISESGMLKLHTGFGLTTKADPFWYCKSCGKLIGEVQQPDQ